MQMFQFPAELCSVAPAIYGAAAVYTTPVVCTIPIRGLDVASQLSLLYI